MSVLYVHVVNLPELVEAPTKADFNDIKVSLNSIAQNQLMILQLLSNLNVSVVNPVKLSPDNSINVTASYPLEVVNTQPVTLAPSSHVAIDGDVQIRGVPTIQVFGTVDLDPGASVKVTTSQPLTVQVTNSALDVNLKSQSLTVPMPISGVVGFNGTVNATIDGNNTLNVNVVSTEYVSVTRPTGNTVVRVRPSLSNTVLRGSFTEPVRWIGGSGNDGSFYPIFDHFGVTSGEVFPVSRSVTYGFGSEFAPSVTGALNSGDTVAVTNTAINQQSDSCELCVQCELLIATCSCKSSRTSSGQK